MKEATSTITADLRPSLLPEPSRSQMRQLFRDYMDARIAFYETGHGEALTLLGEEIDRLQGQMWALATSDQVHPRLGAMDFSLLIQSLNDVIDLRSQLLVARENHVPEAVLALRIGSIAVSRVPLGF